MAAQSYRNHVRYDPKFHFFLMPLCLVCFILAIVHAVHQPSAANRLLVPVTLAVMLTALFARMYAIQDQNRIIRLEEQLRMQRLGVNGDGLTPQQIIALRFASDAELPALVVRARTEGLDSKAIKQAIQQWRPDTNRI